LSVVPRSRDFEDIFSKNDGARLVWALERFVQDSFMCRADFAPMVAPSLVRREPFVGTGYLPQSEEDLYKTQDGDYLAGTAEVGAMAYYMDEILDKKILPLKYSKQEATGRTPRVFFAFTSS
jgi:seryl-tRNA synthetase